MPHCFEHHDTYISHTDTKIIKDCYQRMFYSKKNRLRVSNVSNPSYPFINFIRPFIGGTCYHSITGRGENQHYSLKHAPNSSSLELLDLVSSFPGAKMLDVGHGATCNQRGDRFLLMRGQQTGSVWRNEALRGIIDYLGCAYWWAVFNKPHVHIRRDQKVIWL